MLKFTNTLKMYFLTICLGAATGTLVWCFLKIVSILYRFCWTTLPETTGIPWSPLLPCLLGGLALGLLHRKYGDYPEELQEVLGKVKADKHYDYSHMFVLLLCALIPLAIGASVGPEAGLTGIITGLCYWNSDNVKYAREHTAAYNQLGAAATLGALFHVPLFGIFAVEETPADAEMSEDYPFPKSSKLLLYGLSVGAAFLVSEGLGLVFGKASEGFPSFDMPALSPADLVLMLLYIPVGLLLYGAFMGTERLMDKAVLRVPVIAREILAGLCLGSAGFLLPLVRSSGEVQMGELPEIFPDYGPWFLLGMCLVKILLTAFCIRFGLKGGHFFPLIYACCLAGFGISMLLFRDPLSHAIIAAAVINGATLGAQLKKPLAATMLLLVCFPFRLVPAVFVAAAVGAKAAASLGNKIASNKPSQTTEKEANS